MIYLSEIALEEIKRLQKSRNQENTSLRISIKQGGCADLYYILEFDSNRQATDHQFQSDFLSILVDGNSYNYIEELRLDFSEDLMGGGFRFHNPNAIKTCSCGQSFSLENKPSI
jgi:iron-sulfur cluster assembly protein